MQQTKPRLWVPRRRVPVRILLSDQSVLDGSFYADAERANGKPGRVIDRLNHATEKHLPIATDNRHILLNKAAIVTVRVSDGRNEIEDQGGAECPNVDVRISLVNRTSLVGKIPLPESGSRALDALNANDKTFLALVNDGKVTLVNGDYIVGVAEVFEAT